MPRKGEYKEFCKNGHSMEGTKWVGDRHVCRICTRKTGRANYQRNKLKRAETKKRTKEIESRMDQIALQSLQQDGFRSSNV